MYGKHLNVIYVEQVAKWIMSVGSGMSSFQ